ncbi:hypothetical protein QTP86_007159 [Hemibagrus guttatus]|nr:hypothetical protein QTP86_007159 [Hemibagrus guttatus]
MHSKKSALCMCEYMGPSLSVFLSPDSDIPATVLGAHAAISTDPEEDIFEELDIGEERHSSLDQAKRSVDDAVNMALHFILQHLDSPGSYARILFMDFSSAFNTIIPALLRDKLFQLNVPDSMCSWIMDFLTDRRQFVRLGTHVSDLQHISTGSPQGCVLSPLLFSLYTNSCTSGHQSVKLLKFADDTTLIGLISDGDESA